MPNTEFFSVEGLSKRFGGINAVQDLSLTLARGELVGLIGPNGSGKTTTINMVAGALRPDRGEIRLHGSNMVGSAAHVFARRGVARTFQVPRLFRRMTVLENLMVPGLSAGTTHRSDSEIRAHEILEFLRLEPLADAFARALSGGQQKLLELGRALMLHPSLLLLDEPFAGVHPKLLREIADHISQLSGEGYAIIVVDHNIDAIRALVRRTVVMAQGRKIADGAPDDVLRDPAVVRAYTGMREAN